MEETSTQSNGGPNQVVYQGVDGTNYVMVNQRQKKTGPNTLSDGSEDLFASDSSNHVTEKILENACVPPELAMGPNRRSHVEEPKLATTVSHLSRFLLVCMPVSKCIFHYLQDSSSEGRTDKENIENSQEAYRIAEKLATRTCKDQLMCVR